MDINLLRTKDNGQPSFTATTGHHRALVAAPAVHFIQHFLRLFELANHLAATKLPTNPLKRGRTGPPSYLTQVMTRVPWHT